MEFETVNIVQSEIIYKQINPEDFRESGYTVQKEIISPTEQGYISTEIKEIVNRSSQSKETVIINAGVGQGKTRTIMELAKAYYESGYVLVFAVPYKSLIDQYCSELGILGVSRDSISDYRDIDSGVITPQDASQLNIHLLTINAILGNPGEDFIQQSQKKIEYINLTIKRCETQEKKVVLILDEIHDGIHNFQEKYIFNLWKWRNIINKIFAVSATYNEASKVVLKYLAELTENKIQIIESERIKIEEKQSELFLMLYYKPNYDFEELCFLSFFKELLHRNRKVNILSYSQTISENIIKGSIGKLLEEKYGKSSLNLCTSKTNNKFDIAKCNIGTTFSTGINVKGNDSAFVIILPHKQAYSGRNLGIFSSGINTLIQAIARVRDKSEVYIITPPPEYLINPPNNHANYDTLVRLLHSFNNIQGRNLYQDLNNQKQLIENTYVQIRNNVQAEIEYLETTRFKDEPTLRFPCLENFILSDGEKVLSDNYDIFGKNLSIYTFWAAFNDQFLNCRLKGISVLNVIYFNSGSFLEGIKDFIYGEYYEYYPTYGGMYSTAFNFLSDLECFNRLIKVMSSAKLYMLADDDMIPIDAKKSSFVKKIIAVIQLLKKQNEEFENRFYSDYVPYTSFGFLKDNEEYTSRDYLLACFAHALRNENDYSVDTTLKQKQLINAYRILANFYKSFKARFAKKDRKENYYFENSIPENSIPRDELMKLYDAIREIKRYDLHIKKDVFSFFQNIKSIDNPLKLQNHIYSNLKRIFFDLQESSIMVNGERIPTNLIVFEAIIPNYQDVINLLFVPKDAWFENPVTISSSIEGGEMD